MNAQRMSSSRLAAIRNAMTVDVEDYFQVSAFASLIDRDSWPQRECRVERNVDRILCMFSDAGIKATFFTLGWIAERYPSMVRRIVDADHEIASHGYAHQRASEQERREFDEDIRRSKAILEDVTGEPVSGYRAPSFSIGAANQWALESLQEAGYRYSSSIYPIRHDHYGMPAAPRFPYHPCGSGLLEVPVSTARVMRQNLPAGGGGYFRLMPYALSRGLLRHLNEGEGQPAVFYFHPWEIDPEQPRPAGASLATRFRHYVNLSRMEGKIRSLLTDFAWSRMDRLFLEAP
ncbi:XrtA system polysaccharide deacetylase [Massilia endophytica]|uniref:XrtA system polysaccharide deacetylase n=1 Tax=Massilia endophytica TaxID=2899220 RepID=UPI001E6237BB|nr:XrtA system polysaccharide deacetylase [Massilia endophytica]UGQ46216.1 DUF3473 domain-containing protein [Massilia endophytica]